MFNNSTTLLGRKYIETIEELEDLANTIPNNFTVIAVFDYNIAKISHGIIKLPNEVMNQQTLCSAVNATLEDEQVIVCKDNGNWIIFEFSNQLVYLSNDLGNLDINPSW
jgi:hypothetical protein